MNSMAVVRIVETPWLRAVCTPKLFETLTLAASTDFEFVKRSPSLQQMDEILSDRILGPCGK